VSFDLVILAIDASADLEDARAMTEDCQGPVHRDGELDARIVAFYWELRALYPDHPPYDPESPWMSMPLDVGIDHVSVTISHSPRGSAAVETILSLARRHGLIIYDPQADEITRPETDRRR
jgi:hypothetical protein